MNARSVYVAPIQVLAINIEASGCCKGDLLFVSETNGQQGGIICVIGGLYNNVPFVYF